ncbi:zeta toxin family protein [Nocardia sp. NPDC019395]
MEEPVLYVVGGQPGAGKSTLVERICDRRAGRGGSRRSSAPPPAT